MNLTINSKTKTSLKTLFLITAEKLGHIRLIIIPIIFITVVGIVKTLLLNTAYIPKILTLVYFVTNPMKGNNREY